MTEIVTQQFRRTVSAGQLRQLLQLGTDAAVLLSAMPKRAALAVRVELVRLVEALKCSPRVVGLPQDEPTSLQTRRIAERVAEILRSTPDEEHSVIWACFAAAVRERQEMDEFVADWAVALREES